MAALIYPACSGDTPAHPTKWLITRYSGLRYRSSAEFIIGVLDITRISVMQLITLLAAVNSKSFALITNQGPAPFPCEMANPPLQRVPLSLLR
jgi:hypothetical protein